MPDDKKLVLSRQLYGSGHEFDEISVADGSLKKLSFRQDAQDFAPSPPEEFTVSPKGDKLAFVVHTLQRVGLWRRDLLHPEAAAVNLVRSTRRQDDPQYSPDGKHIAFTSSREGPEEIWMSEPDGTDLSKLSDAKSSEAAWPRWSPDGRKITFSSRHSGHWEVYIVDVAERLPRKLVS